MSDLTVTFTVTGEDDASEASQDTSFNGDLGNEIENENGNGNGNLGASENIYDALVDSDQEVRLEDILALRPLSSSSARAKSPNGEGEVKNKTKKKRDGIASNSPSKRKGQASSPNRGVSKEQISGSPLPAGKQQSGGKKQISSSKSALLSNSEKSAASQSESVAAARSNDNVTIYGTKKKVELKPASSSLMLSTNVMREWFAKSEDIDIMSHSTSV